MNTSPNIPKLKETINRSSSDQPKPLVTLIIPTLNEEKYIHSLIENILQQDYPSNRLEVFLIDGMSSDHTQKIISEYHELYPYIQLMRNAKRFVPFALNLGIGKARGEVIIRMDAHSAYPKNYISALVEHLFLLQADNVGGVWDTKPANNSAKANSIAVALSSSFGVGNSHYRVGVGEIRKVDTVPYGCFHKTLFDRIGLFDNELLRNQDDEFNARIIENGGSIYLIPNVTITYYARPDIASLTKMFYQYAFFKPLVNRKLKKPATIRQFVPPLFVLFLLAGWTGAIIAPPLLYFYFGGVGLYLFFNLLFTIKSTIHNRKVYLMAYLPWIFLLQHLSYGLGYLAGTLNFTFSIRKIQSISNSR